MMDKTKALNVVTCTCTRSF